MNTDKSFEWFSNGQTFYAYATRVLIVVGVLALISYSMR